MLDSSLRERLREPDLGRARRDALDGVRAIQAMERIGAAIVFSRVKTMAIPDTEITLSNEPAPLDLRDILPDWSPEDRARLLTRPVFDPATFGRARLHNDNEGVVSAYLASKWLERLRATNLSQKDTFDLIFAETYGIPLVKPSMMETAAWLALSNEAVAKEVVARDPFLLLTAGDPASLAADVRCAVLDRSMDAILRDTRTPLLDHDSVMRFARPDMSDAVQRLWTKHKDHPEARQFLLRLIWLGRLKACGNIASEAAFAQFSDRSTALFAERALVASGDDIEKRRYVVHLLSRLGTEHPAVIWNAIEDLFPVDLSVDQLLTILAAIDVTDRDGNFGFDWGAPKLISRLRSRSDLERLLAGLLEQLGTAPLPIGHQPSPREEAYFRAVGAAAHQLLLLCKPDEAPLLAIDAVLRLGEFRHDQDAQRASADAASELRRTSASRRQVFWRASDRLSGHSFLNGCLIQSRWEMEVLGWNPGLQSEDVDWLLTDAPNRAAANERCLVINSALELWRDAGSSDSLRTRIEAIASNDSAMQDAFRAWFAPRAPSAEERASLRQLDAVTRRAQRVRAKREKSWTEFAAEVRANPQQLRELRPVSAKGVDGRLFGLWQLLQSLAPSGSRYAIDTVAPLEPLIGREAALAVRGGLIGLWRVWRPILRSERAPERRSLISSIDCMSIAGITLEAIERPNWSEELSPDEARRATAYATLEINGLPTWTSTLARSKPDEVREVLMGEIVAEFNAQTPNMRCDTLDDANRADICISQLLARPLLDELRQRSNLPGVTLSPLLAIVARGLDPSARAAFVELALGRFNDATELETASLYLSSVFALNSAVATDTLLAKFETLGPDGQGRFAQAVLPRLFGDGWFRHTDTLPAIPFESLERLLMIAFGTIRVQDDRIHPSGEVYSPDGRDNAEHARSAIFKAFIETPGRATFNAINRLSRADGFPIPAPHLEDLARERAAKDSEAAPWRPSDPFAFEQTFETAPSTPCDLQQVLLRRLADIQYDLLHSDFAQGRHLSAIPDEKGVQIWVADRLHLKRGRSYSVERESHVADEKEPDVRLRSRVSDANVPTEIKVAERWTVEGLESAVDDQLCARYLRAAGARHGVLLLVHLKPRARGWPVRGQKIVLSFLELVARLRTRAAQIAAVSSDSPQPEIAVLDVSSCVDANVVPLKPRKARRAPSTKGPKQRKSARVPSRKGKRRS